MRYLERTASDLPVSEAAVQSRCKTQTYFQASTDQNLIYSPQNKVLAVIDAIEAAQYLISHNATHLINRVIEQNHFLYLYTRNVNAQKPKAALIAIFYHSVMN